MPLALIPAGIAAAGIGAAGAVAGGLIAAGGAKGAAKTQANAANYAADLTDKRYQQTRGDLMPYSQAGIPALARLSQMSQPGFQYQPTDPSYAFRFNEGTRAVNTSAAAAGNRLGGGTLKALTRYGQGAASQEYGADFARQYQLASLGENAAAQTGNFGAQAANAQGGYITGGANATAAGQVGSANALGGTLSSLGGIAANYGAGNYGPIGGGGSSGYSANVGGLPYNNTPLPGIGFSGAIALPGGGYG